MPPIPQGSLFPSAAASADELEVTVDRVTYASPDGSFAVVRVVGGGGGERFTCVGSIGTTVGETYRVQGTWQQDPRFGRQYRLSRAVPIIPTSPLGMERYLAGLHGFGPTTAKKIVERFGAGALDAIRADPSAVARAVKGLGLAKIQRAATEIEEKRAGQEVFLFLFGAGLSEAYARRAVKRWGDKTINIVRENPFRLCEIHGIGFLLADEIARNLGVEENSAFRLEAALVHVLRQAAEKEGSCCMDRARLVTATAELLRLPESPIDACVEPLARRDGIVLEDGMAFVPSLHRAEREIAAHVALLRGARGRRMPPPPKADGAAAAALAALSEAQRAAVEMVRENAVSVITGPAGSGKTTTLKAVIDLFVEAGMHVALMAPTGKAAKRMSEATGHFASTIHRALGMKPGSTEHRFNAKEPFPADLICVDESTMCDCMLARDLIVAVRPGATLLLMGDVNQLPSVGPGYVLADMIASGVIPVSRLSAVFRQRRGSAILDAAHAVLRGESPIEAAGAERSSEFRFVQVPDVGRDASDDDRDAWGRDTRQTVVDIVARELPAMGFRADEIGVVVPTNKGRVGVESLNGALQAALNPGGAEGELKRGARPPLRRGDRVLHTKNAYSLGSAGIFNGDQGMILSIGTAEDGKSPLLAVRINDEDVNYDRDHIGQLELAYALSGHKMQGDQRRAVVVIMLPEHWALLRRNWLYTALTRARELLVLVGTRRAIGTAARTEDVSSRATRLKERLREAMLGRGIAP